jgi:hypothetical protein
MRRFKPAALRAGWSDPDSCRVDQESESVVSAKFEFDVFWQEKTFPKENR